MCVSICVWVCVHIYIFTSETANTEQCFYLLFYSKKKLCAYSKFLFLA